MGGLPTSELSIAEPSTGTVMAPGGGLAARGRQLEIQAANFVHGSHHILTKDDRAVPVPVHGARDIGAGLLAAIQRQTGVKLK